MPKASLRETILDAGLQVMFKRGYAASGVRDIVAAASSPQGSFTNHFRSKEAFAVEVLQRYFDNMRGFIQQTLGDASKSPRERLRAYLDLITAKLESREWTCGCLIGNFSVEASTQSEELRLQLSHIFAEWRLPFAACIREGQQIGEIDDQFSAEDIADFLIAGWQGTMLRMKVDRSPKPIQQFKAIAFATFLGSKRT
ncbi:MAG: TetR family transcriptional regulator C-terminal domain-containing protein [Pseudomonadota bacterium]